MTPPAAEYDAMQRRGKLAQVAVAPVTAVESDRLAELEGTVGRGLASFMEVGAALHEIRERRLYRATHREFHDYLTAKWGNAAIVRTALLSLNWNTAGWGPGSPARTG